MPEEQKQEVDRLARLGQRHSNPEIAAAAEGWAQVVMDAADPPDSLLSRAGGLIVNVVLELTPFGGDWGPSLDKATARAQLAWAERVLTAR